MALINNNTILSSYAIIDSEIAVTIDSDIRSIDSDSTWSLSGTDSELFSLSAYTGISTQLIYNGSGSHASIARGTHSITLTNTGTNIAELALDSDISIAGFNLINVGTGFSTLSLVSSSTNLFTPEQLSAFVSALTEGTGVTGSDYITLNLSDDRVVTFTLPSGHFTNVTSTQGSRSIVTIGISGNPASITVTDTAGASFAGTYDYTDVNGIYVDREDAFSSDNNLNSVSYDSSQSNAISIQIGQGYTPVTTGPVTIQSNTFLSSYSITDSDEPFTVDSDIRSSRSDSTWSIASGNAEGLFSIAGNSAFSASLTYSNEVKIRNINRSSSTHSLAIRNSTLTSSAIDSDSDVTIRAASILSRHLVGLGSYYQQLRLFASTSFSDKSQDALDSAFNDLELAKYIKLTFESGRKFTYRIPDSSTVKFNSVSVDSSTVDISTTGFFESIIFIDEAADGTATTVTYSASDDGTITNAQVQTDAIVGVEYGDEDTVSITVNVDYPAVDSDHYYIINENADSDIDVFVIDSDITLYGASDSDITWSISGDSDGFSFTGSDGSNSQRLVYTGYSYHYFKNITISATQNSRTYNAALSIKANSGKDRIYNYDSEYFAVDSELDVNLITSVKLSGRQTGTWSLGGDNPAHVDDAGQSLFLLADANAEEATIMYNSRAPRITNVNTPDNTYNITLSHENDEGDSDTVEISITIKREGSEGDNYYITAPHFENVVLDSDIRFPNYVAQNEPVVISSVEARFLDDLQSLFLLGRYPFTGHDSQRDVNRAYHAILNGLKSFGLDSEFTLTPGMNLAIRLAELVNFSFTGPGLQTIDGHTVGLRLRIGHPNGSAPDSLFLERTTQLDHDNPRRPLLLRTGSYGGPAGGLRLTNINSGAVQEYIFREPPHYSEWTLSGDSENFFLRHEDSEGMRALLYNGPGFYEERNLEINFTQRMSWAIDSDTVTVQVLVNDGTEAIYNIADNYTINENNGQTVIIDNDIRIGNREAGTTILNSVGDSDFEIISHDDSDFILQYTGDLSDSESREYSLTARTNSGLSHSFNVIVNRVAALPTITDHTIRLSDNTDSDTVIGNMPAIRNNDTDSEFESAKYAFDSDCTVFVAQWNGSDYLRIDSDSGEITVLQSVPDIDHGELDPLYFTVYGVDAHLHSSATLTIIRYNSDFAIVYDSEYNVDINVDSELVVVNSFTLENQVDSNNATLDLSVSNNGRVLTLGFGDNNAHQQNFITAFDSAASVNSGVTGLIATFSSNGVDIGSIRFSEFYSGGRNTSTHTGRLVMTLYANNAVSFDSALQNAEVDTVRFSVGNISLGYTQALGVPLTWSLNPAAINSGFSLNHNELSYRGTSGSYSVTLTARHTASTPNQDSATFIVNVSHTDLSPVIANNVITVDVTEDSDYNIDYATLAGVSHPNEVAVSYSMRGPNTSDIDSDTGFVTGTSEEIRNGSNYILQYVVTVSDPQGDTAQGVLRIRVSNGGFVVTPENPDSEILDSDSDNYDSDAPLEYTFYESDRHSIDRFVIAESPNPGDDTPSWSLGSSDSRISIENSDSEICELIWSGNVDSDEQINLMLTGSRGSLSTFISLRLNIRSRSQVDFDSDSISVYASLNDQIPLNSRLEWFGTNSPESLTPEIYGADSEHFALIPVAGDNSGLIRINAGTRAGTYSANVRLNNNGSSDSDSLEVVVTTRPIAISSVVNDASLIRNALHSRQLPIASGGLDPIVYSLTPVSNSSNLSDFGIVFNSSSRTYTVNTDNVGSIDLKYLATDGNVRDSEIFTVNVFNTAPVFSTADLTLSYNEDARNQAISIEVYDSDSEITLSYDSEASKPSLTFGTGSWSNNSYTNTVYFSANEIAANTDYEYVLKATDSAGDSDTINISITVRNLVLGINNDSDISVNSGGNSYVRTVSLQNYAGNTTWTLYDSDSDNFIIRNSTDSEADIYWTGGHTNDSDTIHTVGISATNIRGTARSISRVRVLDVSGPIINGEDAGGESMHQHTARISDSDTTPVLVRSYTVNEDVNWALASPNSDFELSNETTRSVDIVWTGSSYFHDSDFVLTLVSTDVSLNATTIELTVTVEDNTSPSIISNNLISTISDSDSDVVIGEFSADQPVSWSLSGTDSGSFSLRNITSSTANIVWTHNATYGQDTNLDVTLNARDAANNDTSIAVSVTVEDNTRPVLSVSDASPVLSNASLSAVQNASTISANTSVNWSLSGDSTNFSLSADSGTSTILRWTTQQIRGDSDYSITITGTDSNSNFSSQVINVSVTDDLAPAFTLNAAATSVRADSPASSQLVATALIAANGEPANTWHLDSDDSDEFTILSSNASSAAVSWTTDSNALPGNRTVALIATDTEGNTYRSAVTVEVIQVVKISGSSGPIDVSDSNSVGHIIGGYSTTNTTANTTWTLSGDSEKISLSSYTGSSVNLILSNADTLGKDSEYSLTLSASDTGYETASLAIAINYTDDTAPTVNGPSTGAITNRVPANVATFTTGVYSSMRLGSSTPSSISSDFRFVGDILRYRGNSISDSEVRVYVEAVDPSGNVSSEHLITITVTANTAPDPVYDQDGFNGARWSETGSGWLYVYFNTDNRDIIDSDITVDGVSLNNIPGFSRLVNDSELESSNVWITAAYFTDDSDRAGAEIEVDGFPVSGNSFSNQWRLTEVDTASNTISFQSPAQASGLTKYIRDNFPSAELKDLYLWSNRNTGNSNLYRISGDNGITRDDSELVFSGNITLYDDSDQEYTPVSGDYPFVIVALTDTEDTVYIPASDSLGIFGEDGDVSSVSPNLEYARLTKTELTYTLELRFDKAIHSIQHRNLVYQDSETDSDSEYHPIADGSAVYNATRTNVTLELDIEDQVGLLRLAGNHFFTARENSYLSFGSNFARDEDNNSITPIPYNDAFDALLVNRMSGSGSARSGMALLFYLTNSGNVDQTWNGITIPANDSVGAVAELAVGFVVQTDENGAIGANIEDLAASEALPSNVTITKPRLSM